MTAFVAALCVVAMAAVGCSGDDNGSALDSGSNDSGRDAETGPDATLTEAGDDGPALDARGSDAAPNGMGEGGDSSDGAGQMVDSSDGAAPSGFVLLATMSPPGPTIAQNLWSGVLEYAVAADGAPFLAGPGIASSQVADPIGLAVRPGTAEVFVGNRHGNTAADGVSGSISRFIYNPLTGSLTSNGTITGNGLNEVSQIVFDPVSGEMFAANFARTNGVTATGDPAVSRFTFDASGNAVAHGTLGNQTTQGLALSPDGKALYATSGGLADQTIRSYDLATGNMTTAATITDAPRLFYMAVMNGELYLAALDVNKVYRLSIAASDNLTLKDSFGADGPIAIAFSPDGNEMFTSGHLTSDIIDRFGYNAQADSWMPTMSVTTPSSLGGIVVIPGAPTTFADAGATTGGGVEAGAEAAADATTE